MLSVNHILYPGEDMITTWILKQDINWNCKFPEITIYQLKQSSGLFIQIKGGEGWRSMGQQPNGTNNQKTSTAT